MIEKSDYDINNIDDILHKIENELYHIKYEMMRMTLISKNKQEKIESYIQLLENKKYIYQQTQNEGIYYLSDMNAMMENRLLSKL